MPDQRNVAGLLCSDVLARLSDYLDGDLPDNDRIRIEGHLRGCDWCEKFGGEFTTLVTALRRELRGARTLDAGLEQRLKARLRSSRD